MLRDANTDHHSEPLVLGKCVAAEEKSYIHPVEEVESHIRLVEEAESHMHPTEVVRDILAELEAGRILLAVEDSDCSHLEKGSCYVEVVLRHAGGNQANGA
jgi:hypothetical protein